MHGCLLHIYARAFTSFIIYLITMGIGHGLAHVYLCPDKDLFVVMLMSSIRLYYFFLFKAPE
jgi:hypothetical protein